MRIYYSAIHYLNSGQDNILDYSAGFLCIRGTKRGLVTRKYEIIMHFRSSLLSLKMHHREPKEKELTKVDLFSLGDYPLDLWEVVVNLLHDDDSSVRDCASRITMIQTSGNTETGEVFNVKNK